VQDTQAFQGEASKRFEQDRGGQGDQDYTRPAYRLKAEKRRLNLPT
jgi:hypothetical protein